MNIEKISECLVYCDNSSPIKYSRPIDLKNKAILSPDGEYDKIICFETEGVHELFIRFRVDIQPEEEKAYEDLGLRVCTAFL